MKRFLVAAAAVGALLLSAVAIAANTQVSAGSLKAGGATGFVGGRSDGVFQDAYTGSPVAVENAQRAQVLGVGYRETFAYGAAKGLSQLDIGPGLTCVGNTTTVPCMATFGSGVRLAWAPVVTETLELAQVATGLDVSADLVDNDGLEIFGGILGASGRPFIVGDDPAFYGCWTIKITDVSGTDDLHVGFRRPEPMNAVFDNYLDLASIGNISGAITIETIDDNAATVTTDTTNTWADAATKTLCVGVGATGAVAYSIDGSAPTVTAAVTLDDGDPMIPFLHYIHAADVAESTILSLWQVGYCFNDNAPADVIGTTYVAKRVCDAVQ